MSHGGAASCTEEHCSSGGLRDMLSRGSTACQVHHMKICKNSKEFALYLILSSESFLHISATPPSSALPCGCLAVLLLRLEKRKATYTSTC